MSLSARLRDFGNDESGVTAVEFSLLAPMFVAVVMTTLMLGVMELSRAQLDQAAEIAKRGILTGQVTDLSALKDNIGKAVGGLIDPRQIMVSLKPYSSIKNVSTDPPTLTYDEDGRLTNHWTADFGASDSVMVLQLVYQMPVVSSLYSFLNVTNGTYELVATQVFTRE